MVERIGLDNPHDPVLPAVGGDARRDVGIFGFVRAL